MDVHHHTHTARKKFKDYFFEFFMLFIAVFSGFLAEYFLEHIIERNREKEFIESMYMDLKDDTVKIKAVSTFNEEQGKGLDSLLAVLYSNNTNKDSVQKAYRLYYSWALNYNNVVFTDRTLTQLKNSGGLRLIRNQNVSDSIMNYDAGIKACETQFDVIKNMWTSQSDFSYSVFDLKELYLYRSQPGFLPSKLLTTDTNIVRGYTSRLLVFSAMIKNYAKAIEYQKQAAINLMIYLHKQYNLKAE